MAPRPLIFIFCPSAIPAGTVMRVFSPFKLNVCLCSVDASCRVMDRVAFISLPFPARLWRMASPNSSSKKSLKPLALPLLPLKSPNPPNPPKFSECLRCCASNSSACCQCSPYSSYFLRFCGSPRTSLASFISWNLSFASGASRGVFALISGDMPFDGSRAACHRR